MAKAGTEDCLTRCFITVVISGLRSATHRDVGNTNRVGNTIGAVCGQKRRRGARETACDPQGCGEHQIVSGTRLVRHV